MIKENVKRFSIVVTLSTVFLLYITLLTGCHYQQTGSENEMDLSSHNSKLDIQNSQYRPPTSRTLFAMSDILAVQGRDKECEFVLKRIIQEYPRYLPAYNRLAELQMRQGCIKEAIDTIHDAFRIISEEPLLMNNLGVCWVVSSEYDKALTIFTKAAGMEPKNSRYRMNMAMTLGLMERYKESLSLFRQVLPEDQANHNLSVLRNCGKKPINVSAWQESP